MSDTILELANGQAVPHQPTDDHFHRSRTSPLVTLPSKLQYCVFAESDTTALPAILGYPHSRARFVLGPRACRERGETLPAYVPPHSKALRDRHKPSRANRIVPNHRSHFTLLVVWTYGVHPLVFEPPRDRLSRRVVARARRLRPALLRGAAPARRAPPVGCALALVSAACPARGGLRNVPGVLRRGRAFASRRRPLAVSRHPRAVAPR